MFRAKCRIPDLEKCKENVKEKRQKDPPFFCPLCFDRQCESKVKQRWHKSYLGKDFLASEKCSLNPKTDSPPAENDSLLAENYSLNTENHSLASENHSSN